MSSYADDVFEMASEAALKHVGKSELTGSALDKCELERSHLMLCVYGLFVLSLSDRLIYQDFFFTESSPLERGWRKPKDTSVVHHRVRLKQDVVSVSRQQQRGQRITAPVPRLFAREKRPYGLGMIGRLTNRTYRKRINSFVKKQIEDMDDHRFIYLQVLLVFFFFFSSIGCKMSLMSSQGPFFHTGSHLSMWSSPSWL